MVELERGNKFGGMREGARVRGMSRGKREEKHKTNTCSTIIVTATNKTNP